MACISRFTKLPEQFVTFLFVGVLNTLVGYGLYAFFVWVGCNYIFAPLFSTVLGVLFNFKTIGVIVFQSHNNRLLGKFFGVYGIVYGCNVLGLKCLDRVGITNNRLLGKFFGVYGIVYGCNVLGLKCLDRVGITNMYIAGAILVLPLALLGFCLNKKWVFKS